MRARIDAALARAGRFLIAAQGDDGAIRSDHYAYFRDGYSLTPLALAALYGVPDDPRIAAAYARGVDFLVTMLAPDGRVREDLYGPRYPLYSTAIATIVLNVPKNQRHRAARDALIGALRRLQLGPELDWKPDDLSFGGWSYGFELPRRPAVVDESVTANLSATLYAVGALRLAGVPIDDPALVRARNFVERCQNFGGPGDDGGFFFSPAIADGNKAGALEGGAPGRYRSYGSMTADGVRALVRLGVAVDHPRIVAAAAWLEAHFDTEKNPGDFAAVAEVRRDSSYFYWTWSAAHALRDLGKTSLHTPHGEVRWASALAETLLARQRADGSWANPQSEMREDDPIVATSFATAALAVCRVALTGEYKSHAGQ